MNRLAVSVGITATLLAASCESNKRVELAPLAWPQGDKAAYHSVYIERLRGRLGVTLSVEQVSDDARKMGITETLIEQWVSRRLKQRGVPVLDDTRLTGLPTLYIQVGVFSPEDFGRNIFDIVIAVKDEMTMRYAPNMDAFSAEWWREGEFGILHSKSDVQSILDKGVDSFALLFMEANRKDGLAVLPDPPKPMSPEERERGEERTRETAHKSLKVGDLTAVKVSDSSLASDYAISVTVTNVGASPLTGVQLTYRAPEGWSYGYGTTGKTPEEFILEGTFYPFEGSKRGPIASNETGACQRL